MRVADCPRQHVLVPRVEAAMGVSLYPVSCHLVDKDGMANVMGKSGWSKNETVGVVGFQVGRNVYVRQDAPWTVLHELVHRSGVNADRLNRWVAEGLTEAIAQELKQSDAEHRATYPAETDWTRRVLLQKLGLSAVQLGRILAKAQNAPRALAELLVKRDPKLDVRNLERQLAPQRPDPPSFSVLHGMGHTTVRDPADTGRPPLLSSRTSDTEDAMVGVGTTLVIAGFALLVPAAIRRYAEIT